MESVRDQADDDVHFGNFGIEGVGIIDVELEEMSRIPQERHSTYTDGSGVLNAVGEGLRPLQGPAGNNDLDAGVSKNLSSGPGPCLVNYA